MILRTLFHILLSLRLSVAIFGVNFPPEACFCGQGYGYCLSGEAGAQNTLPYPKHCHGSDCKSCKIARGISLYAQGINVTDDSHKSNKAQQTTTRYADYLFNEHTLERFSPDNSRKVSNFSPIYLQNSSLLF
jgi:hypothetical protein